MEQQARDRQPLLSVVQRVFSDSEFRNRLRQDPVTTLRDVGLEISEPAAVERLLAHIDAGPDVLMLDAGEGKKVFAALTSGSIIAAACTMHHGHKVDDAEPDRPSKEADSPPNELRMRATISTPSRRRAPTTK